MTYNIYFNGLTEDAITETCVLFQHMGMTVETVRPGVLYKVTTRKDVDDTMCFLSECDLFTMLADVEVPEVLQDLLMAENKDVLERLKSWD